MACFNSGIVGHIAWVCQNPKRGSTNRSEASSMREESSIFTARVCTKGPRRRTGWFGKVNWRGKANTWATPALPMALNTSSTPTSFNQMTDYEWVERDETHQWELKVACPQMAQVGKTMQCWSDCTANKWGKWNAVSSKHNKMDVFIKEATEHKCEKQELLIEMKVLKQKIDAFDYQLKLSKGNLDIYFYPQAEADNIKDILSNIASNAINNNLERIAEQGELGTAAANGGKGFVENHYRKLEFYVDSPVRTLPKSSARNNMNSNITKFH